MKKAAIEFRLNSTEKSGSKKIPFSASNATIECTLLLLWDRYTIHIYRSSFFRDLHKGIIAPYCLRGKKSRKGINETEGNIRHT